MPDDILINTGTGVTVWTDQSGTRHAQVVKVSIGADSTHTLLAFGQTVMTGSLPVVLASDNVLSASGVTIASVTTGTMHVTNVLSATGVTIASVTTGTFTVAGTPTVTVSGTSIYGVSSTNLGTTGAGFLIVGIQATTARAMAIHTTGGLIIATMPAVGGGQQYTIDTTDIAATGTGTLIIGIQTGATTAKGLALSTTGGLIIASMPAVGGGSQYQVDTTGIAATGTGTLVIGVQSGATTARGLAITTTGAAHVAVQGVLSASGVTIASITTGTVTAIGNMFHTHNTTASGTIGQGIVIMGYQATTAVGLAIDAAGNPQVDVINVISASGVTIASVTTGTMNVINVLSASGVTVASVTTGTMHVINVLSATGVLLAATTASIGAVIGTAHASRWNAYAVSTTSGGGHAILKTSGAHTLYITDLMVSVDVPMNVSFYSSSAAQTPVISVFLATKGGFAFPMTTPLVITSAQSLVFIGSLSGSCAAYAAGHTVT